MSNLIRRRKNLFSLFDDDFFDSFFSVDFNRPSHLLKTNIIEENDKYILEVEAPGLNKEAIKLTWRGLSNYWSWKNRNWRKKMLLHP